MSLQQTEAGPTPNQPQTFLEATGLIGKPVSDECAASVLDCLAQLTLRDRDIEKSAKNHPEEYAEGLFWSSQHMTWLRYRLP